jgi:hypothetical protein
MPLLEKIVEPAAYNVADVGFHPAPLRWLAFVYPPGSGLTTFVLNGTHP